VLGVRYIEKFKGNRQQWVVEEYDFYVGIGVASL
jgi:hypothetical protein